MKALVQSFKKMFNTLVQSFKHADLSKRILFTLLAFLVFKIMTYVTVPLINKEVLSAFGGQTFFGFANALTGGALRNFSIIALGVSPYITASIVIQLLQMDIVPVLAEWGKEGETGKQKINQVTRYTALALAFIQALTMAIGFNNYFGQYGGLFIPENVTAIMYVYIALIMTAGTAALLWISDQITAKGIGNGSSMIIMAGIIATFPDMFHTMKIKYLDGSITGWFTDNFVFKPKPILTYLAIVLILVIIVVGIVYMQNATRKIPIQYANRANSATLSGKKDSHLPIKLNPSGVIPVIFAASLMSIPTTFAGFITNVGIKSWINEVFNYQRPIGFLLYVVLIYLFSFFYSFVQVSPEKVAENLRKQGSYIPGVRPGAETENFISGVLLRTTVIGATYLMLIAIIPILAVIFFKVPPQIHLGGTSLLIVVGVAQETFKQLETKTKQNKYSGFIK